MCILDRINSHNDLLELNDRERAQLCHEIREFLVDSVSRTGGHLAGNLGIVELSVAIETVYNPSTRSVNVKARFKSDVAKPYRYHIFLLEDGIQYMQMGVESGSYVHDNVLRRVIGSDARGTRLISGSALEAGKEYVVEKTLELSADWKAENMRVLVAMLKEDSAAEWGSYNANVCAMGESVDYLYKK